MPQAFTRIGVADRFEFDIIGPNYEAVRAYAPRSAGSDRYGVDDSGLGFKYEFVPTGKWTIGVDGLYTAPNGSKFLTAGSASYTGNLRCVVRIELRDEHRNDDCPRVHRPPRRWPP